MLDSLIKYKEKLSDVAYAKELLLSRTKNEREGWDISLEM